VNPRGEPWGFPSFVIAAVDRPEPLRIALEPPAATGDKAQVKGVARSGNGVSEVLVMLNGTQVAREESHGGPKPTLEFSLQVPLTEGKNVLLATAARRRAS
jgi:hypothetical protein